MIMAVRQDTDAIRTYCNIGTGNFNPTTSKFYTDYSYFTCKKAITDEVLEVFNYLTGRSIKQDYKKLLVAPFNMYRSFIRMIEREIGHKKRGRDALIVAKMNQLEDPGIIDALYKASKAGVKIKLIVRGFCCLKPGIKGLSENIQVYSLIGRLLEHSRVYYFKNGKDNVIDGDIYIGSADWMSRNLSRRVEVITPIMQKGLKQGIWDNLQIQLSDNRHLWEMNAQGQYTQRRPSDKKSTINSQALQIDAYKNGEF